MIIFGILCIKVPQRLFQTSENKTKTHLGYACNPGVLSRERDPAKVADAMRTASAVTIV